MEEIESSGEEVSEQVAEAPEALEGVEGAEELGNADPEQQEGEEVDERHVEENVEAAQDKAEPFHKHPRWIKMRDENASLKEEMADFEARRTEVDGMSEVLEWIKGNPAANVKALRKLMYPKFDTAAESTAEEVVDPYAELEPEYAQKFREHDELKQKVTQYMQAQEQTRVREIKANDDVINDAFVAKLKEEGLIDEDGNVGDDRMYKHYHRNVGAELNEIAKDPERPTIQELNKAYETHTELLRMAEKRGLKKAVDPKLPPTGSKGGMVPAKKRTLKTQEDIANYLAEAL